MTDLTRYLELAGRLERDTSIEASEAIRSLVERVRVRETALSFYADDANWGDDGECWLRDGETIEHSRDRCDCLDIGQIARAALAQGKPGEGDELPTPSGHAES